MKTANLLKIDSKGNAELIARGGFEEIKKQYVHLPLGKGETAELLGVNIHNRKRGDAQDVDVFLAAKAKENAKKLAEAKAKFEETKPKTKKSEKK